MNPLTTVKWPLIIGFLLSVLIAALIGGGLTFNSITMAALARWLHIFSGIFWIGLLCLALFLIPVFQKDAIPNGAESKFTLGLPQSPWFTVQWTDTEEKIENGTSYSYSSNHSHRFAAELTTWSAHWTNQSTEISRANHISKLQFRR